MELREYVAQEIKRLNQFEKWWLAMNKDNPEMYPMKMLSGDWDEQAHFFEMDKS